MTPPDHHKEIAQLLRMRNPGELSVTVYRDSNEERPIPIGKFGNPKKPFFSSIGALDTPKALPPGEFEFAACGFLPWLPNALVSSIYWLEERGCTEWPLVCEDVVRDNADSTYRHMAYIPSLFSLDLSSGQHVQWLLGIPITDREIDLSHDDVEARAREIYPEWLFNK